MQSPTSSRLRKLTHDITPPVLVRAARSLQRRRNGASNASKSGGGTPQNPDLIEYGPDFYDTTFENEERWREPYWKMGWYGSWAVVGDRVVRAESPRVLDMGCGAGHLPRLLADRGLEHYTGFDFSPNRLDQARILVPEFHFEVADAYVTDLFDTVDYNIVTCTEFLEHLGGDLEILRRIRSGTRLIGTVPNYDAQAHLRYFHSASEVEDRYSPLFSQIDVAQIHNTSNTSEWLIDGLLR